MIDKTPFCNHGVNTGAVVGEKSTHFNGSSYIRIPDSPSLSPIAEMSAAIWVKGTNLNNYIFSHYDFSLNEKAFAIRYSSSNRMTIYISADGRSSGGNFKNYISSIIFFDDIWHLVGFTFNAGTLKIFADGVEDAIPTKQVDDAITTIYNSSADVMVGCCLSSNIPSLLFTGDLARPKIWKRTLTDAEWKEVFDKGR